MLDEKIIPSECPLCGERNMSSIKGDVELIPIHCSHCDTSYYYKKNGTGYSVMKK